MGSGQAKEKGGSVVIRGIVRWRGVGGSGLTSDPPFRMDGCGRAGESGWKEGEIRQAVEGDGS